MEFEHHLPEEWKTMPAAAADSEKVSACFDCSICLDFASDPVVTLCGHLYCWPCIYKWLQSQNDSLSSNECKQCPVCKSEISLTSVVPLYGRGKTLSEADPNATYPDMNIPPRPKLSPRQYQTISSDDRDQQLPHNNSHENYQNLLYPDTVYGEDPLPAFSDPGSPTAAVCHPVVGMFGEMVYARVFGNSEGLYAYPNSYCLAGSRNPRLRRQEIAAHKSLSRVSFFLLCCILLCLFLF